MINTYIVSIANAYHWTPKYIETLYVDKFDYYGLEFWYKEIERQHKEINSKK